MNNVPEDLDELKICLWNRFGQVRNNFSNPGSLKISAELPRSSELDYSQDSNLMLLSSSEDLQSFIM